MNRNVFCASLSGTTTWLITAKQMLPNRFHFILRQWPHAVVRLFGNILSYRHALFVGADDIVTCL